MSEKILNGTYEKCYKNGQLRLKRTFKNDKLGDPCETYYKNGQLWIKCTYKNG